MDFALWLQAFIGSATYNFTGRFVIKIAVGLEKNNWRREDWINSKGVCFI